MTTRHEVPRPSPGVQSEFTHSTLPVLARDVCVADDPVLGHIEIFRLTNGIRVALIPRSGSPLATLVGVVDAGALDETPETYGAAHFLEHMPALHGTRTFPGNCEIVDVLRRHEGSTNAATGYSQTRIHVQIPGEHVEIGLHCLAQMLFEPLITDEGVAHERGPILSELRSSCSTKMNELIAKRYPQLGFDRSIVGTEASLNAMTPEILTSFHARHYQPSRISLYLVGNLPRCADRITERFFGSYQEPAETIERAVVSATPSPPSTLLDFWGSSSTKLKFLYPAPITTPADKLALYFLATVLYGTGEYSLFDTLRTKMGSAYATSVAMGEVRGCHWIEAGTEVPCEKSMTTLPAMKEVLERTAREHISDEARLGAIRAMKAALLQRCLDPLQTVEFLTEAWNMPPLETPGQLLQALAAFDPEVLRDYAARTFLNETPSILLSGGYDQAFFEIAVREHISRSMNTKTSY